MECRFRQPNPEPVLVPWQYCLSRIWLLRKQPHTLVSSPWNTILLSIGLWIYAYFKRLFWLFRQFCSLTCKFFCLLPLFHGVCVLALSCDSVNSFQKLCSPTRISAGLALEISLNNEQNFCQSHFTSCPGIRTLAESPVGEGGGLLFIYWLSASL